jgi:hypothetical protein
MKEVDTIVSACLLLTSVFVLYFVGLTLVILAGIDPAHSAHLEKLGWIVSSVGLVISAVILTKISSD